MDFPVVTKELAEQLEQSEIDYMTSRVLVIKEREGNPMGADVRTFGGATAFYVKEMPWGTFNSVRGIGAEELGLIDDIIRYYGERSRPFQFEIIPSKANAELLSCLDGHGFYQAGFHATLYGIPSMEQPAYPSGITIREMEEEEFGLYCKLHCLGTGLSVEGAGYVADNNRVLYERQGWKFFIGHVDEQPAGVAVMYVNNGIASLTFAATLPEYRRRGLQTAFLQQRLYEAGLSKCKLVVGQATYASISQNNMERAGLRIGYTRTTWMVKK
ncbi:GNAT family N-acetyltransferase [Paenibacillus glycanilyticus]|uniref:GNAT family N-acetyltransferase n=1 Tax=Paenibacillus glycanilyticus TaxID=126569 RepID=UPI0020407B7B|nr:GNAT family N-acetyltransferase [Paenibacillus glycanilyticus]MCM3628910.1 GNAT family N-acetyltransferase [Paenibacillus glycanilyticus]